MPRRVWTEALLRTALRELQASGQPLTIGALRATRQGRRLVAAVYALYGSWPRGLAAMGLDRAPAPRQRQGRRRRRWDEPAIRAALVRFIETTGGVLRPSRLAREDNALYEQCRKRYGGVWQAVAALGLSARPAFTRWSRERIQARIAALGAAGVGLRPVEVRQADPALYQAALRAFGSWEDCLAEVGPGNGRDEPTAPVRGEWADEELLRLLLEHRARSGGPLPLWLLRAIRRRHGRVAVFYARYGLRARSLRARS